MLILINFLVKTFVLKYKQKIWTKIYFENYSFLKMVSDTEWFWWWRKDLDFCFDLKKTYEKPCTNFRCTEHFYLRFQKNLNWKTSQFVHFNGKTTTFTFYIFQNITFFPFPPSLCQKKLQLFQIALEVYVLLIRKL